MGVPINNVTRRVVFAASGTGPYAFTFEILAATDISVYRDDTLLTLTTNYTVTINSNGTGSVTLTAAPTGATQIAIVGNRTIQRTSDFVTGGDFFANTLNDELDQQTIFAQQNAEGLQRALQAPQTDPTTIDMTLPRAADRANKTLAFDANGDPTLGISAADVANAVTYATNAANSATAAAASASAAASSASSASGSASTATTQASNASTSASSASTSASNASTSATNAASSASSASTSASNASTSATNAASSASTASTQATNASNSASAAATSATNAANSATAAATSETNAATSAAAAAAALDNFDDRYLGAKSANPTVDNDGNALVTGALYYRTTTPVGMKVWDGSQWLEASAAQQSLMVTYEYVATAGQTTFSGTDANGATLSYVANSISVSLNGVVLRPGEDYTATTGTSIVLTSAAALSDELVVIAFAVFNVANAVAKTGDTMTGSLTYSAGTANGVAYLNGSKVLTTGTALVFDGTNLGVGGTPSYRLDVSKATAGDVTRFTNGGASNKSLFVYTDATYAAIATAVNASGVAVAFDAVNNKILFTTSSTNQMFLDSSGNLGLGVTPSAWSSGKAIETGSLGTGTWGGSGVNYTVAGYYYNSGDKFAITGNYAMYSSAVSADGTFRWYSSTATGTAGNAATISERMRLDASGQLLINRTSTYSDSKLAVNGWAYVKEATASAYGFVAEASGNDAWLRLGHNGTVAIVESTYNTTAGNTPLTFYTGGVERVRIDVSGYTQFVGNLVMPYQGAPTTKNAAATLTGAELVTGILSYTGAAATVTLPTGTNIEGALTWSANNVSMDWFVINTGSGTCTIGANGNTTLGALTVTAATSAQFRIRRTAANTFTVYRLG